MCCSLLVLSSMKAGHGNATMRGKRRCNAGQRGTFSRYAFFTRVRLGLAGFGPSRFANSRLIELQTVSLAILFGLSGQISARSVAFIASHFA